MFSPHSLLSHPLHGLHAGGAPGSRQIWRTARACRMISRIHCRRPSAISADMDAYRMGYWTPVRTGQEMIARKGGPLMLICAKP
jgi:hypothetical protein